MLDVHGPAVAKHMARLLDLQLPQVPWHTHRDRLASLGCALGIAAGTLGKIARDIGLLSQTEVGEAREGSTGGVSSTMPQKQNPVHCAIALASAVRAPGLVATMLTAMVQEHERALGGWQAEWDTLPELAIVAADAAHAMAGALEALVVDPARMRANLDASCGLVLAEAVVARLAPHVGKSTAHALVEHAVRRAGAERVAFADVLAADPQISAVLDRRQIDDALTPEKYLGSAAAFIADVLARHSNR
jgi:3-carboxy-cis,cis-muconate cycloisomerase